MRSINLIVRGNPVLSYGKIQLALCKRLETMGIRVNVKGNLHPDGIRWLGEDWVAAHQGLESAEVTLAFYKPHAPIEKFGMVSKRMWLLTMSESTQVSQKWVACTNRWYERVFVGCPDLVKIYQDSGVEVPVEAIPLGLDFEPIRDVEERDPNPEHFVWLTYSVGDGRKGADLAIQAFKQAFGGDMRYKLWIKSMYTRGNWLGEIDDPQIAVVPGKLSEEEWWGLLRFVQAFVWLTHGEGFGLPIREAVLAGLPAVGTQWLGMSDIDWWGYPVLVSEMVESSFIQVEANEPGSRWAQPDMGMAAANMKEVAERYHLALIRANEGRQYLLNTYTYDKTAGAIAKWL
jgi:glycosyltransferase involved in cell wall biosynthesis